MGVSGESQRRQGGVSGQPGWIVSDLTACCSAMPYSEIGCMSASKARVQRPEVNMRVRLDMKFGFVLVWEVTTGSPPAFSWSRSSRVPWGAER